MQHLDIHFLLRKIKGFLPSQREKQITEKDDGICARICALWGWKCDVNLFHALKKAKLHNLSGLFMIQC